MERIGLVEGKMLVREKISMKPHASLNIYMHDCVIDCYGGPVGPIMVENESLLRRPGFELMLDCSKKHKLQTHG